MGRERERERDQRIIQTICRLAPQKVAINNWTRQRARVRRFYTPWCDVCAKNHFHYYTVKPLAGTQLPAEFMAGAFHARLICVSCCSERKHNNAFKWNSGSDVALAAAAACEMQRSIRIRRKKETPLPCPHFLLLKTSFFAAVRQTRPSSARSCILSRQNKSEREGRGFLWQNTLFWRMCMHKKSVCGGTHIVMVEGKNGVKYAHINRVSTCVLLILPCRNTKT